MTQANLTEAVINLLCDLIRKPSFSREESDTADLIAVFLTGWA